MTTSALSLARQAHYVARPMPTVAPVAITTDVGETFAQVLRRFDTWMQLQGWSDVTRHKYRYEVICFAADYLWLEPKHVDEVTSTDVLVYVGGLARQGSKRGDALRALKALYRFEALDTDPTEGLKIPRPKFTPAPELDQDMTRRLLAAAFHQEPRRGWAILLCLATGARVSSLVAVRPIHLHLRDPNGPWLYFAVTKGDRPYSLPLSHRGAVAATHLLALGHDPLLGVGAARFRQWVHAAEQSAGLDRVWPHLLRHTFASQVARSGDVESWRRAMNHADLSQWPRYVHASDKRLRDAVDT